MATHTRSGNSVHDNNMIAATGVWQVTMAGSPSAATAKAADIAWARTGLASAKANGVQPGQFIAMLFELGTGGQ